MNYCNRWPRAILALAVCAASTAHALDPFDVYDTVPATPAGAQAHGSDGCVFGAPPTNPLSLNEAIERAMCANPSTSEAWATVKLQASRLGISRSARLPTMSLSVERDASDQDTAVHGHPELDSGGLQRYSSQQVLLNWALLDLSREADIRSSEHLLAAAQAGHALALLQVYADLTRQYFSAQTAAAALASASEIETTARASHAAARDRVDRGVAPVSDALQALTSLAEATLQRQRALGTLRTATGALAFQLGLRADTPLTLPAPDEQQNSVLPGVDDVSAMIELAEHTHPRILQAARQLDAALSRVDQARADTLPKLGLSLRAGHNSTPVIPAIGESALASSSRTRAATLSITMPLFDGFASNYRIDQAAHTAAVDRAQLEQARQAVANDIWSAWNDMTSADQALKQSTVLRGIAVDSFNAANERYRAGVGSISDLLAAQSALTNARERRLQATYEWQTAATSLSARLGVIPLH